MRESKLMTFCKNFARIILKIFYRVEVFDANNSQKKQRKNSKNISQKSGFILAANHIGKFDPLILMKISRKNLHFFAKKEIGEKMRFLTRNLGLIFVDRDKKNDEAILCAEKFLRKNMAIAIFSEGTRNPKIKKSNELLPFKIGAVKIAAKTGAPIIPIAMSKKGKIFAKIRVTIGEKIFVKNDEDLFLQNENLREEIAKMLKNQGVKVRKIPGKPRKNPGRIH